MRAGFLDVQSRAVGERSAREPADSPCGAWRGRHAYWQDAVAVISIEPVEVIAGSLPLRQRRLVEAWAELHQGELLDDWNRLQQGQAPVPIEPLP